MKNEIAMPEPTETQLRETEKWPSKIDREGDVIVGQSNLPAKKPKRYRYHYAVERLVRRVLIRMPCWICDKCGWRERREAEVLCWKCTEGEMIYRRPSIRIGKDKRGQLCGQWFRSDGSLRFVSHSESLTKVIKEIWRERSASSPQPQHASQITRLAK